MSTEPDPERIAAVVAACPLVDRLDGGRFGQVASYLPGRTVAGVLIGSRTITVSVVGRAQSTAARLLAQITEALAPVSIGFEVTVVFADIATP